MSKTVTTTIRIDENLNNDFTDFARAYGITKQDLIVRSVQFCIAHNDVVDGILVPTFTIDRILDTFKRKLIAECGKRVALLDAKDLNEVNNES